MDTPKLDAKKLDAIWREYHTTREIELRDQLIVQYLYLVKYVVGRVSTGFPGHVKLDDLYSSGVTGLIRAIERFDITKKSKFIGYATLVIKGAIIDELRQLDWVPRSVHQKSNQVTSAMHSLQQRLGREPTDRELSSHLGIGEEELGELLERIRPAILISLNAEMSPQNEESGSLSERIADVSATTSLEVADRRECAQILSDAIEALPDQERKVLTLYYFEELMLKEIGKIMGVSESRISQIHTKALLKLRRSLSPAAKEFV